MKNKILSMVLAMMLMVSALGMTTVFADLYFMHGYLECWVRRYYGFEEIVINSCDESATGELIIPSEVNGYPVGTIGERAFWGCNNITSIIIPRGVVRIDPYAFLLGTNHKLTSISIPDTMHTIGTNAFLYCENLQTVYYEGTKEQWNNILIYNGNEILTKNIIFLGDIKECSVTLNPASSKLGAYELITDFNETVGTTYKVVTTTVPFGRKAVITANGEVISANTEYTATEDTVITVAWESDGTNIVTSLPTAYEGDDGAAVFAKFNGIVPHDYGFIVDGFIGKKFGINGAEYVVTDGKLPATNHLDGVFGIKIAGVAAGTYTAVPYAGDLTSSAITFNIK